MKRTSNLFIIVIAFFILGFFNIVFAWLGFACLILPFVFLYRDKKKTWCQIYCPRANLFTVLFKNRSITGKGAPSWLIKGNIKKYMLIYFGINIFILFMSTLMVVLGNIDPVEKVRFMIAFQLPWDMAQFVNIAGVPDWVIHLSFRIYSMMFSTTVIGLILGWLYKPKTWCAICPINTLSDMALKKGN